MPKVVKKKERKLTPKQKKFIKEYLDTNNATEAATRAYKTNNRNTAWNIWCDNLKKPNIKGKLQELWELSEGIYYDVLQWKKLFGKDKVKPKEVLEVAHRCHDKHFGKAVLPIQWDVNLNLNYKEIPDEELDRLLNA